MPPLRTIISRILPPLFLAFVWLYFSRLPLAHTDLWGHLGYGQYIVEHGQIKSEPFLPLAWKKPVVDTVWMSRVLGYWIFSFGGAFLLQQVYAALVTTGSWFIMRSSLQLTHHRSLATLGAGVWLAVSWYQQQIIRPQAIGLICCCAVIWCLLNMTPRSSRKYAIAGIFFVWANCHGSFPIGWLLIACVIAGRFFETVGHAWSRGRSGIVAFGVDLSAGRKGRRLVRSLGIAIFITLLNPNGRALWGTVASFSFHPNLDALIEWQPLRWSSRQGVIICVSSAVVVLLRLVNIVLAWRRRSMNKGTTQQTNEVNRNADRQLLRWRSHVTGLRIAAIALGIATVMSARFINWFAFPIALLTAWELRLTLLYVSGITRKSTTQFPLTTTTSVPNLSLATNQRWSERRIVLGTVLLTGLISPIGTLFRARGTPRLEDTISLRTPIEISRSLNALPDVNLVFCPMEWGDYLQWDHRDTRRPLPVFANSHVHLLPPFVWDDYLLVMNLRAGWEDCLDQWEVDVIVLDRRYRHRLIGNLERAGNWNCTYSDSLGAVFVRSETDAP